MAKPKTFRGVSAAGLTMLAAGTLFIATGLDAEPAANLPVLTTVVPIRFPIRVEQVRAAAGGVLALEGATFTLAAPMTASTEEPALAVTAVEPWGDRRARVRIGCVKHEQCLAFYAVAEWPDAPAAKAALTAAGTRPHAEPGHSETPMHLAAGMTAFSQETAVARAQAASGPLSAALSAEPQVRVGVVAKSGAHATLLLEGDRMHIKVPVICLESGEVGHTIRVAATDHKQTYSAEVVDATLLKGTL